VAEAVVDTAALHRKIERMMALAPDTYEVDLEIGEDVLTLRTVSPKGEGLEKVAAETTGEIKVRLIGSHLSRMLKYVDAPSVRLSFSGESTPVRIGSTTNDKHFYLTLPIA
jgi:DNA polymerase III sliding clamp (beta) subunit (PCNA family)